MKKKMPKAIEISYKFNVGGEWIDKNYTATTYEDYHRVVRILHENEDHYKVVNVRRVWYENNNYS